MTQSHVGYRVLAAVVGLAIAGVGIAQGVSGSPEGRRTWNGQELFRAIYFGSGPASAHLSLGDALFSPPPEVASLEQDVVSRVAASDPGFFERFAAEIQSGNPYRVETVLFEGGALLRDALVVEFERSDPNLAASLRSLPDNMPGEDMAGAIVAVIVVAVVLWVWTWTADAPNGPAQLKMDEVVASITVSFAR